MRHLRKLIGAREVLLLGGLATTTNHSCPRMAVINDPAGIFDARPAPQDL